MANAAPRGFSQAELVQLGQGELGEPPLCQGRFDIPTFGGMASLECFGLEWLELAHGPSSPYFCCF